jgi:hypothetical protein
MQVADIDAVAAVENTIGSGGRFIRWLEDVTRRLRQVFGSFGVNGNSRAGSFLYLTGCADVVEVPVGKDDKAYLETEFPDNIEYLIGIGTGIDYHTFPG